MPNGQGFASKAQQGFMFAKHPEIAKRWAKETPNMKALPEHKESAEPKAHEEAENKRIKSYPKGRRAKMMAAAESLENNVKMGKLGGK